MKYIYKYTMNKDLQNEICNFKFNIFTMDKYYNSPYPYTIDKGNSVIDKTRLDIINNKFEFKNKPFIKYARFYKCKDIKEIIQENTNSNKNVYGKREILIKKLFQID